MLQRNLRDANDQPIHQITLDRASRSMLHRKRRLNDAPRPIPAARYGETLLTQGVQDGIAGEMRTQRLLRFNAKAGFLNLYGL